MQKIHFHKLSARFLFILLTMTSLQTLAQTVSGTITSEDGAPIPTVNVLQKGTHNGAVADFDGKYSLSLVNGEKTLVFSYVGFKTKEIKLNGRTTINVTLREDSESLDEVVVVGYAKTKRKNILGAVSSVDAKEIEQTTPVNAFDAIQGRLAGVSIKSNNGPGNGSSIQIRGPGTFNSGTEPLYVVDGQQLDNIDNIDPSDIASIEVVKDGAAAAIYGSRSANGVVIITTKRGKTGKTKIDVNYNSIYSFVSSHIPVASTKDRLFYTDVRRGNSTGLTDRERDSLSLLTRNSFDLQSLLFRPATRNQVNVALSGGTETGDFYWNTGYMDEQGTVIGSYYKRFNTQFKVNANLFNALQVGTSTYLSYDKQRGINEGRVFGQVKERIPYFPVFEPNGTFTPIIAGRRNPIASAEKRKQTDRNFRARSSNYAELKILPSLKFKSSLSLDFRFRKRDEFAPRILGRLRNGVLDPPFSRLREQLDYNLLQENLLTYKQAFGDHHLSGILGTSWQKWTTERTELRSKKFLFDEVETFNAIEGGSFNPAGTRTLKDRHALIGYFAQASYDYKERYLVDAIFRRDGSSRVGANKRFDNFKSGSIGWRLSGEPFMKNVTWLDNLLFKASYGENGNQSIGNYDNRQTYSAGNLYAGINGVAFSGQLGNPDLVWENTKSKNFGVNMTLFKHRLKAGFNYYIRTSFDLLASQQLPSETGFTSVRTNIGSVENRGVEIDISGTPLQTENFSWYSSFNIATLKNKVLDVADDRGFFDVGNKYRVQEGKPIGDFFGFKNKGIFRYDESNAFTDDGVQLTPNFDSSGTFTNYTLNGQPYTGEVNQLKYGKNTLKGGDVIWDDVNGDFNISKKDDRQVIGNGLPKFFGGFFNEFTYKNLSLSFLFDYNFGNDILRNYDQARNNLGSSNATPSPDRINKAWLHQGDVAEYATLNRSRRSYNGLLNSQYVNHGDYIKLSNVKLSYQVSQNVLKRAGFIHSLSLQLSVNNLATWTNYNGYNPELGDRGNALQPGLDNLRYPNKSDIIFGIKVRM